MKIPNEIMRQASDLMIATRVQQDVCDEGHVMFVVIDENNEAVATFTTFIEAYRYRLTYIICKLEG